MAERKSHSPSILFYVLIILITLVVFVLILFLNEEMKEIRLIEVTAYLKDLNREEARVDHLNMVNKFKLQKALYYDQINETTLDREELEINYLVARFRQEGVDQETEYTAFRQSVLWIINQMRRSFKKAPLTVRENPSINVIAAAYYYERNKQYEKALALYDSIEKSPATGIELLSVITLHQGFCYAIIDNYSLAREKFLYILSEYKNSNVAVTAALLLSYLEEFSIEIEKVKESGQSDLEKAARLFKLAAYDDALELLKTVPEEGPEAPLVAYYKGRAYEETGRKKESLESYQKLIAEESNSDVAELANRRILLISVFDKEGGALKELAKANNRLIQDKGFEELLDSVNSYEEVLRAPVLSEEQMKAVEPVGEPVEGKEEVSIEVFAEKAILHVEERLEAVTPLPENPATPEPASDVVTPSPKLLEAKVVPAPYRKLHHDSVGNLEKVEFFDAEDNLLYYYIYEYDEHDNVTLIKYDKFGNPVNE